MSTWEIRDEDVGSSPRYYQKRYWIAPGNFALAFHRKAVRETLTCLSRGVRTNQIAVTWKMRRASP